MRSKSITQDIYEHKGVFGDEDKFMESTDRLEVMLKLVRNLKHTPVTIFDFGGGTGYFSQLVKEVYPSATVYCGDISHTAMEIGKQKYPQINFVFADAESTLPFEDNFFDLVISGEQIEHLTNVDIYLSEMNRVTKKEGHLILSTPNLASWLNRFFLMLGIQPLYLEPSLEKVLPLFSLFGKTFPENLSIRPAGHLRLYTLNILKKLLAYYGFHPTKSSGVALLNKPLVTQVDKLISHVPSLASGLVILASKKD